MFFSTALSAAILVDDTDAADDALVDYGDLISVYPTIRDFEDTKTSSAMAETEADLDNGANDGDDDRDERSNNKNNKNNKGDDDDDDDDNDEDEADEDDNGDD